MGILRTIGLYVKYLQARLKYQGRVHFNGFTVVYCFSNSSINFMGGRINSSPLSNLVELSQRSFLVARYGGRIDIGENTGISGSTIYSMICSGDV